MSKNRRSPITSALSGTCAQSGLASAASAIRHGPMRIPPIKCVRNARSVTIRARGYPPTPRALDSAPKCSRFSGESGTRTVVPSSPYTARPCHAFSLALSSAHFSEQRARARLLLAWPLLGARLLQVLGKILVVSLLQVLERMVRIGHVLEPVLEELVAPLATCPQVFTQMTN
jgi:hypothetical protein